MNSSKFKISQLVFILILGIVLGTQIGKIFSGNDSANNIVKLNDVLTYTEKYYVEEVDTPKLVDAAINGMLTKLDPHSVYIPADQAQNIEESIRGDYEGIGIEFQIVSDTIVVVSPISGGPSEILGIQSGDRIIKINGEDAIGLTTEKIRNKLRGDVGTKVNITIYRPETGKNILYEIIRDKIPLYSVDAHFMYDDITGYINISRFSKTTYDELKDALNDLKKKGMKQLVLDLRGNPGGIMNQAVKVSDLFISDSKKIVYTKGRKGEFEEEFHASEASEFEKIPLIILVNSGSASASEIVAGAIQDWDRGLIVGETTFGKGLVQRPFVLPDNSVLRLTVSKYFTPSSRLIQRDYKDLRNKEEYYFEAGGKLNEEGDNLYHSAEKDTGRPVFKTNSGRIVYGGGGITPDYLIKSPDYTEYTTELLKNNIFYQYMLRYLSNSGKSVGQKYKNDFGSFMKDFTFSDSDLQEFTKFAYTKGIKYNNNDFKRDYIYISTRLKAQIARNYWKNEGWFSVLLSSDNQMLKAVTLFNEAKELAKL